MDISKLKRNPTKVQDTLFENKEHQLITKTGCKIVIPASYTSKGLAVISSEVSILGIFAMVIDGNFYSVSRSTSMMTITPTSIDSEMINDTEHLVFTFAPGSVVIKNTMLVKNKKLVNNIMDYFVDYGHSPWFISYVDHSELFANSKYFNDIKLGQSQAVLDIITAHVSRNPKKFEQYYRHSIKESSELWLQPTFIATRDIANNTTSNLARINGSELQRALKASLLAKPERAEPLEQHFFE